MTYEQGFIVFYIGLISAISIAALGIVGIVELYLHFHGEK